jgi:hypothetical protein
MFLLPQTFATEIVRIELAVRAKFSYPKKASCENLQNANPLQLVMEIDDGKILQAQLFSSSYEPVPGPAFTPEEIAGVHLYADPFHRYWLKDLSLSNRQLLWWFTKANWSWVFTTHRVSTVAETGATANFPTAGLGEEILFSISPCGMVTGTTKAGGPYSMNFVFIERQIQ